MPLAYETIQESYKVQNVRAIKISEGQGSSFSGKDMMGIKMVHESPFVYSGRSGIPGGSTPKEVCLHIDSQLSATESRYDKRGNKTDGKSLTDRQHVNRSHGNASDTDGENLRSEVKFHVTNPNDTFWEFDEKFSSWKNGQIKCTLCPRYVDERKGTCDECDLRVHKVKNIFSKVEEVVLMDSAESASEPEDTQNAHESIKSHDSYVPRDRFNISNEPHLENKSPENFYNPYCSVGDYYDSDNEGEQGRCSSSPACPHQQRTSTAKRGAPEAQEDDVSTDAKISRAVVNNNFKGEQSGKEALPTSKASQSVSSNSASTLKSTKESSKSTGKSGREIAVFRCPLCVKVFCQPPVLDYHLYKFHAGTWPFKCKDCKDKSFAYWRTYVIHRHIHRKPGHFMCESCAEDFGTDERKYISHLKCHGLPTWKCKVCCSEFESIEKMDRHFIKFHPENNLLSCLRKQCLLSFPSYTLLRSHLKTAHEIDEPDDTICTPALFPKASTPVNIYTEVTVEIPCEICGVKQETISDLEKHMKELHENITTVICHHCSKLVDINSMGSHMCQKESKHLKCGICSKRFPDMPSLVAHQLEHQTIMKTKDAVQPSPLQSLGSQQDIATPYSRAEKSSAAITNPEIIRGEKRRRLFNVEEHMRLPTPTETEWRKNPRTESDFNSVVTMPNNCPLCPRSCSVGDLGSYVKLHDHVHHGRNPIPCPVPTCGKRFLDSHYAYSHFRYVHRGVKDYIIRRRGPYGI